MGRFFDNLAIPGKHKYFDQRMSDYFDTPARNRIKEVLGEFVEENSDKFGQDFIIKSENCKIW